MIVFSLTVFKKEFRDVAVGLMARGWKKLLSSAESPVDIKSNKVVYKSFFAVHLFNLFIFFAPRVLFVNLFL